MPNGYVLTTQRNGIRLPEYARLDLRADRAFTYRKSRLTLFMEVVNVTNRDNYRPNSRRQPDLAAGLRADRESVSVAAGCRSVDRILSLAPTPIPETFGRATIVEPVGDVSTDVPD